MTDRPPTPSDLLADEIKRVRRKMGISAADLAKRCADVGGVTITAAVIANIESRRRKEISVDEWLTISLALDMAPIHLLVPIAADAEFYAVAPEELTTSGEVREWIRGGLALYGQDPRVYFSEVPRNEWRAPDPSDREIESESAAVQRKRRDGER